MSAAIAECNVNIGFQRQKLAKIEELNSKTIKHACNKIQIINDNQQQNRPDIVEQRIAQDQTRNQ